MSSVRPFSSSVDRISREILHRENYISREIDQTFPKTGCCYHFRVRCTAAALIPAHVLSSLSDTVVGVGAAAINLGCSLTTHDASFRVAEKFLKSSNDIVAGPFEHLVQVLNPKLDFSESNKFSFISSGPGSEPEGSNSGWVHRHVTCLLMDIARDASVEGFWFQHVVSRFCYGFAVISSPLTRSIDLVLGVIAAPFALIAALFGAGRCLCGFARHQLTVGGVVEDVVLGIILTINPWAGDQVKSGDFDSL